MNKVEQFIAVYAPKDDALFRKRLEQVIQEIKNKTQPTNEVISMRDYLATKAMSCLLFDKKHNWGSGGNLGKGWLEGIAKMSELAYEIADAMMEARK